jgi:cytochrome c biogenesis protein CcdA
MQTNTLNKVIFSAAALFVFLTGSCGYAREVSKLQIFYSPGCHRCAEVKKKAIPAMEKKFKGRIAISYLDMTDMENYKLLLSLREKYNPGLKIEIPVFFMAGRMINSDNLTDQALEDFISGALTMPGAEKGELPEIDLLSRFKGLKLFTIVSVGLVDGINPCAFTVIVFFISFLALQGYTKRELTAIGLCFILAVFVTYLLIGLGAFTFLYRINKFWLVSKIINYSVGLFSIAIAAFALHDFFKFRKTGETEGLALQLPKTVKDQIHKVVGIHYRVNKNAPQDGPQERHMARLILSALITGFLISLLEAVCTGQTYLPTITFILKTTTLKLHALAYLVIYNLMFVVPLFIIFVFALLGITSAQFSNFLKKHLLVIKILMAILFFGLGIFLIWRA